MTHPARLQVTSFVRPLLFLAGGLVVLSLTACSFYDSKGDKTTQVAAPVTVALDFATIAKDVFKPACLSCHAASTGNLGGINLEAYATVSTELARIKEQAIILKRMPLGAPLSSVQYSELRAWLDAGAPEIAKSGGS